MSQKKGRGVSCAFSIFALLQSRTMMTDSVKPEGLLP
jgi:hypothetical protein